MLYSGFFMYFKILYAVNTKIELTVGSQCEQAEYLTIVKYQNGIRVCRHNRHKKKCTSLEIHFICGLFPIEKSYYF